MPEARRAAPSSRSGIGLVSWRAWRDSSSSQPGEDRIGVKVFTGPLSHLWRGEAVTGALAKRRVRARLHKRTADESPSVNLLALGLPECQERNYTRKGSAGSSRDRSCT